MTTSYTSGSWDGSYLENQSEQVWIGLRTGDSQESSIPGMEGEEQNPKIEYPNQSSTSGSGSAPPPGNIMRVTLLIPEDEYDGWRSSLPAFVRIRETKVLDNDERTRLGW